MADVVETLELNVRGNLLPITEAFGIMGAALAGYGHVFTDEQIGVISLAAYLLFAAATLEIELTP